MDKWTIKVQTEIGEEEVNKLLIWALRKAGMTIISISKDEENPIWPTSTLTASITGEHE